MAHFPRAPRFNEPKPSDVPPPGAYNPKLPGPDDDAWRKGAIDIVRAPRGKENPAGPDTFGLYNPEGALSPKPNGRRALVSTSGSSAAAVAGKDKEIIRLTSSLVASQSSLASLNSKLADTANSLSTAQRDLRRSEAKSVSAEEKIARLERRFEGVKLLQTNFEALRAEHEKSKAARERELARVSDALLDKEATCETLGGQLEAAKEAYGELAWQASKAVKGRIAANNRFISDTHGVVVLEANFRAARTEAQAADQASQVSALAATVNDLEARLDDADKDAKAVGKDVRAPWRQLRQGEELRASARRDDVEEAAFIDAAAQDLFSLLLSRAALLDKELASSKQHSTVLEDERIALVEEKAGLEGALGEALALNDTFLKSIKSLRSEVGSLETQLAGLRSAHEKLEQAYATTAAELEEERRQAQLAKEAWQGEREGLVGEIREKEKERVKEADARQRLAKALGISRQAETALKEELEEMHGVSEELASLRTEHGALQRSHSKLTHLQSATASHAESLSSLNSALVSHGNNAQKVKVLDRLRREGREEREAIADLESRLNEKEKEVERLTRELKSYQSLGGGGVAKVRRAAATLIRVSRARESVDDILEEGDDLVAEDAGDDAPTVVDAEPPSRAVRRASSSSWGRESGRRATMAPRASIAPQMSLVMEEESLGAVRMDGLMTLEELR